MKHGSEVRPWHTNSNALNAEGRRPRTEDLQLTRVTVSIPPNIAAVHPQLSPETSAAVDEATASIVSLDHSTGAALSGISTFLIRTESLASSRIERVYADADEYARAIAGASTSASAISTLAATRALIEMVEAVDRDGAITVDQLLAAHRVLLGEDLVERDYAGRLRDMQNWIGGPSDFSPRDAIYVPPPPELVDDLMRDLIVFSNRTDIPAVAQAAVAHAQFESIHPFTDGNGRIGRGLISQVLRNRGVAKSAIVPVASAMLANTDDYFSRVNAYRDGESDEFVGYVARSATVAAAAAEDTARVLLSLPEQWTATSRPRRGSSAAKLIASLLENPVLDARTAASITGTAPNKVYEALDRLESAGVVQELTRGSRNRVWVAPDVMDELDRLSERIGRRMAPRK